MTVLSKPAHEMTFVPRPLVVVQVGRLQVSLYPVVDPSMPVFERAHAFQVAKSALEVLPIDKRQILDALGAQLNCSAIVDGLVHDWRYLFDSTWYDFTQLTIVSFHNSAGAQINNTTIAGNATILLPVIDGNLANCRQPDVRFVRVMSNVDFSSLVRLPAYGPVVLRVGFYIELPQTTVGMTNGAGVAYQLTTWHGAADLSTLVSDDVRTLILEPCLQDGPILLRPADFNLGEVNIDSTTIRETIAGKVLSLGFRQICSSIFMQLCPGYSDQPYAVLEHIRQTTMGSDGQPVTASVVEYYQRMLNAARPFYPDQTYAISVCDRFIQGLAPTLIPAFRRYYPMHSAVHNLSGAYQRQQMPIILAAAQSAEDECKHIQDVARGMLQSQGFFIDSVGAFASQAENTLKQHAPHAKRLCWGCGGDHSWMTDGKVTCPRASEPAVVESAKKKYDDFKRNRATATTGGGCRCGKRGIQDSSDPPKKKPVLAADASSVSSNTTSSVTTVSTNASGQVGGPQVFMLSLPVPVFSMTPPSRRVLPVAIQAAFPHITLQLGTVLGCGNCPAIRCVVDTAAALTTGNLHFFAEIAKAYPHTVASIYSPDGYSPITLSGIVQQGGESVTTDLSVGFQFHLPYLTREGNLTSLIVATGCDVTVNIILGLPFITQTRMVIDTSDQVAECRAFDAPPFAIDFRRAMCAVPAVNEEVAAANAAHYQDIVKEVENIERVFAAKTAAFHARKQPAFLPPSILLPAKRAKSVEFDFNTAMDSSTSTVSVGSAIADPKFDTYGVVHANVGH